MGQRGPVTALLSTLGRAHLMLALLSLLCAVALIGADLIDSTTVGGPVGAVLAALLVINAAVRLWLRGRLRG